METLQKRRFGLGRKLAATLGLAIVLGGAAAPAFADEWGHDRRDWRAHETWRHDRREPVRYGYPHYAPRYGYVAPRPYYPPPRVVYGPPSLNFVLPIR